ncbi:hypothetical protein KFZ56_00150 [Virgibacillus sp. NKC19-3]|uniref:hypothetical protein n=1 Tax=Virgibacillus saliphilus TaxID=2831674 RepID=UPI001C9B2E81|nr:hypothetical protein [Virgibacillus sp. NKC19-3]MBY7141543.1 hypothetical protein [Virgibacillus sp. NKC19-3]
MQSWVSLSTMIVAFAALVITANTTPASDTVVLDEPTDMWSSIGKLMVLFLPPFILSLFKHSSVKIIAAIYQVFIILVFLGVILLGIIFSNGFHLSLSSGGFWISALGVIGMIGSMVSIISTVRELKRNSVIH